MQQSFHVVLTPQPDGGFFIECPALPGCYSQGDSEQEALANIQEAILLVLEDMEATGEPIPRSVPPRVAEVHIPR